MAIPSEARDALMRAWLQILRERHPHELRTAYERAEEARQKL